LFIEFNDGKRLLLSKRHSKEDILSLASSRGMNGTREVNKIEKCHFNDCNFAFYDGRLDLIEVISFIPPTKNVVLKIGNDEKNISYKMPLTQKQLFELFGPPDKLQDAHRW